MNGKLDYLYYRYAAPEGIVVEDVVSLSKEEKIAALLEHYATCLGIVHGAGVAVDEIIDKVTQALGEEISKDPEYVSKAISDNDLVSTMFDNYEALVEDLKMFERELITALAQE